MQYRDKIFLNLSLMEIYAGKHYTSVERIRSGNTLRGWRGRLGCQASSNIRVTSRLASSNIQVTSRLPSATLSTSTKGRPMRGSSVLGWNRPSASSRIFERPSGAKKQNGRGPGLKI